MDRFSRTTEIDTAEIAAATMEDDTPKKSKITNIIVLVLCLLISVIIWLMVMETNTDIMEKEYNNIPVFADYVSTTPVEYKQITVKGVRKNIIDLKSSDFTIIIEEGGRYMVYLIDGKANEFTLMNESNGNEIVVSVSEK